MKLTKLSLLSATAFAGMIASAAQAQVVDPAAQIQALGATSIQIVHQQELNCLSGDNPTYKADGTPITVAEANYGGAKPLNCATTDTQPNVSGKYVGTGSGGGRAAWENFTGFSAFKDGTPAWTNIYYAFSDGAIAVSDQDAFRAGAATHSVGNPLQIPLYVLPVAVAYEGQYGTDTNSGTAFHFNVKSTYVQKNGAGVVVGGLRMTRPIYCNIFNGVLTNWNDASLKTANGNQSLMDPADNATRWATDGVPIRLVGRSDSSGTTDILSRHLASVCGYDVSDPQHPGGTNRYQEHAGGLPYDGSINLLNVDSNTTYKGTFTVGKFANITDDSAHMLLSGAYYDGTAMSINTTDGSETPGKFLVADGSPNVSGAISLAPDKASPSLPSTLLNGKVGYIGTDYITPLNGSTLFAASLPVNGSTTSFLPPNAKNAALALTELPPQTTATNGAYNTSDSRTVINPTTNAAETVDRANPLHWTAVLYANPAATLANPVKGYAITGTTQFLPYQCFASVNNRIAVANIASMITGKAAKEAEANYDPLSFTNTSATNPGITVQAGIAPMPAAWNTAISETFLKKSTQASGGFVLGQVVVTYDTSRKGYYTTAGTGGNAMWIQSIIPTTQAALTSATSNGGCTPGAGA